MVNFETIWSQMSRNMIQKYVVIVGKMGSVWLLYPKSQNSQLLVIWIHNLFIHSLIYESETRLPSILKQTVICFGL